MKFHLYMTAVLAAAHLAACQPAPVPRASEPSVNSTEALTDTEVASTAVAQPANETVAAGTINSFPANCPLIAARNWQASARIQGPTTWIDISGDVDIPSAYYDPVQAQQMPSESGATGLRFVLQFMSGPPGTESQGVRTTSVIGSGFDHERSTRVNIFCGDGLIADIPITGLAR